MAEIEPTQKKKNTIRLPRIIREEKCTHAAQDMARNILSLNIFRDIPLCEKKTRKCLIQQRDDEPREDNPYNTRCTKALIIDDIRHQQILLETYEISKEILILKADFY